MKLARRAGVLAHPTSLPGPGGLGDLGPATEEFLDWCSEADLGLWQLLPVGPTDEELSPYASPSSFAGNPRLISARALADRGWLDEADVDRQGRGILEASWAWFRQRGSAAARSALAEFLAAPAQAAWLEDWVLYAALKRRFEGRGWTGWPAALRAR
ncbi:MAG TPA: 4-alpha-glucanotransferase, partial [Candidatus Polarisedimenticolaceae bacterium]|nr:4-alpha-glucanotransferase [Candidatus Polarisedimenticolaceae bacterium]